MASNMGFFADLPTEVIYKIFLYLDPRSLAQIEQTCTLFQEVVAGNDQLWRAACHHHEKPIGYTWRSLCRRVNDPSFLLSERIAAADALLQAEEKKNSFPFDRWEWCPPVMMLSFCLIIADSVQRDVAAFLAYEPLTVYGYRASWFGGAAIAIPFAMGFHQRWRDTRTHRAVVQSYGELSELADARCDVGEPRQEALMAYLRNCLDDWASRDHISRYYLSEHHHLPHYGAFNRHLGQKADQPNAVLEDRKGNFFSFHCWTPEFGEEKGSLDQVPDSPTSADVGVIRSYRADYAIAQNKLRILAELIPNSGIASSELRQALVTLQQQLEYTAAGLRIGAQRQIDSFTLQYDAFVIGREVNDRLVAELDMAKSGDRAVAFTPLLAPPEVVVEQIAEEKRQKMAAARQLLEAAIAQDTVAMRYACCLSGRVIDDGRLVAEDREGHLLGVCSLDPDAVHPRSHEVTRLIQGTSVTFRLADLDNDACAEDFPRDKLLELTLIPSHRTAYAVLARKLCLLREGILQDALQQRGLLAVRDKLRQELVEQKVAHEKLAKRQIKAFVSAAALVRANRDWTEIQRLKNELKDQRLKNELEDQLERAENGDQGVQFTPLFALTKVQEK
jgi:hypothetical protein